MSANVRALVLAEELLLSRGVVSMAREHGLTDAISVESFERARRMLGTGRSELVVWIGDVLDRALADELVALRRAHPDVALLLVLRRADPAVVGDLVGGGGNPKGLGLLLRTPDLDAPELLARVGDALAGRPTLDSRILEQLFRSWSQDDDVFEALTASELEILELVSLGLRNREIARRLWKSEKAVEKHVGHLFVKLGLRASDTHLDRRVTAARIFLSRRRYDPPEPAPRLARSAAH